jgi:hypothetical protein
MLPPLQVHYYLNPPTKNPPAEYIGGGRKLQRNWTLNLSLLPLARRHAATARTMAAICNAHLEVIAHLKNNTHSHRNTQGVRSLKEMLEPIEGMHLRESELLAPTLTPAKEPFSAPGKLASPSINRK